MAGAKVTVFTSEDISADREVLRQLVTRIARGAWSDFKMTNKSTAGKASKTAASLAVGSAVAQALETLTPLQWAVRGFGPLPMEFTKSGAIHVFEFTTLERALKVAQTAAAKFILVTIAYEGGVVIGSLINQTLPNATQDAIGGTIDEIVNHGGWMLLFKHPFGIRL